jgi:pimeloyl-ACP methyl ester carboxylesterase
MPAHAPPAPWIFLRGLTRGSGHWGRFIAEFESVVPHANVIALDTAGNGARYREQSPCNVAVMVEDCRAQLRKMGCTPPYQVLALSLGGMVAALWAQRWPQEVQRLVLLSTSMRPLNPFYERLRPANYPVLVKLIASGGSDLRWEQEILRITTRHPQHDVLADWVRLRESSPVSGVNALRQLVAAARFRLPAASGMEKVLLLAGQEDQLVSPECTLSLARHWNCTAVLHPTAGHDVPLDDGPWVAAQVRL